MNASTSTDVDSASIASLVDEKKRVSVSQTSAGSTKVKEIPGWMPFPYRKVGGGTRLHVYGTSWYGSGYYPDATNFRPGVDGRNFPYGFLPLIWPNNDSALPKYLFSEEYYTVDDPRRPGGPLFQFSVSSNSSNAPSTFRIVADEVSAKSLVRTIGSAACLASSANEVDITTPVPFASAAVDGYRPAEPQQALQYYRASSVVLTLDGYNDTALYAGGLPPYYDPATVPPNANAALLLCVNATVGSAVPLMAAAPSPSRHRKLSGAAIGGIAVACVFFVFALLSVTLLRKRASASSIHYCICDGDGSCSGCMICSECMGGCCNCMGQCCGVICEAVCSADGDC